MQLKENNKLKLISFLIAILLFLSVNENFKNFSVLGDSTSDNATAWVSDVPLDVDYDRDKLCEIIWNANEGSKRKCC